MAFFLHVILTAMFDTFKEHFSQVVANCKFGLIGSGVMLATKAVAELSGEREVRFVMMYIGLIVGVLTIIKLAFELGPAWEKFRESWEKRKQRKQREKHR